MGITEILGGQLISSELVFWSKDVLVSKMNLDPKTGKVSYRHGKINHITGKLEWDDEKGISQ